MNYLSLLLIRRYLFGAAHEKSIATMTSVCFGSICLGTFALALILSIMNGFEKVTHTQLQGIHAHLIVRAYGNTINSNAVKPILETEFPSIASWSPTTTKQGIIRGPHSDNITNVVLIKGINPTQEAATSTLQHKIISSIAANKELPSLVHDNSILIGKGLAQDLEVAPGAPVTLLFAPDECAQGAKITLNQHAAIVGGVFSTGIDEFDNGLLFCSLDFLQQLWPECGIEQINIKLKPSADEATTIANLRNRLGLEVYSWKDLYPALVAALKLEKYALFFILLLVIVVASMNIVSLAFMHITKKRTDRALLQSMGMDIKKIRSIYVVLSLSIACAGAIVGLLLAGITGYFLATYPFITLPDTYYMSQLPIVMEWQLFILVFIVVIALSALAAWIPSRNITHTTIADILRHET